jgi:hypothetical protein
VSMRVCNIDNHLSDGVESCTRAIIRLFYKTEIETRSSGEFVEDMPVQKE